MIECVLSLELQLCARVQLEAVIPDKVDEHIPKAGVKGKTCRDTWCAREVSEHRKRRNPLFC